jgi:cytosine/adenosine deaminase-related metal-dependent hydrolase
MWLEARQALLLAKLNDGADAMTARAVLEMATRGGAACLGRSGELGTLTVGAAADIAVWGQTGFAYAGAVSDPIEAWLRCGPTSVRNTIINGKEVVKDGHLVSAGTEEMLTAHAAASQRVQRLD